MQTTTHTNTNTATAQTTAYVPQTTLIALPAPIVATPEVVAPKVSIRSQVAAKFNELLAQREQMGNTVFRRAVMDYAQIELSITLAAAATHYNHAFQTVKTAKPELVLGLGRADDKKGGRKPKVVVTAETPAGTQSAATAETVEAVELHAETQVEQTIFNVCKKATGEVVLEGVDFTTATALVAKHAAQKKAKLYWV